MSIVDLLLRFVGSPKDLSSEHKEDCPYITMSINHCISLFYQVLLDLTGSYWVLPGLIGSYRVLPGLTESFWVLPGPIWSYQVLPGLSGSVLIMICCCFERLSALLYGFVSLIFFSYIFYLV